MRLIEKFKQCGSRRACLGTITLPDAGVTIRLGSVGAPALGALNSMQQARGNEDLEIGQNPHVFEAFVNVACSSILEDEEDTLAFMSPAGAEVVRAMSYRDLELIVRTAIDLTARTDEELEDGAKNYETTNSSDSSIVSVSLPA